MQNKQFVVEFLLFKNYFQLTLPWLYDVSEIIFFETDIAKHCTKMSSSFF